MEAELRAKAPPRAGPARARRARGARRARARRPAAARGGVVTRRLARAADDGYRNPLVPGLRATADAERLAAALTAAAARLEPPGPYPAIADRARPRGGDLARLPARARRADARAAGRARSRRRPRWADGELPRLPGPSGADRRGLPRLGGPRRLPGGRLHRRGGLDAASAASPASSSASRCPASAARRASTCSPRSAPPGPTARAPASCTRRRGRRDDDRRQARCSSPATGMLLERRARELADAAGCRSPRSTAASRLEHAPGAAADLAGELPGAIPAALALR